MYPATDCPCSQHCYSISLKICHQHFCKRIILPGHCLYYIYYCICYSAGLYNALSGTGTIANPLNITFKNAFLFAISNLPYVLILLLLNALPILLFLGWTELFIVLIPFYLFMGFAGTCYVNCRFLKKIFKPYVPEESKTEEI